MTTIPINSINVALDKVITRTDFTVWDRAVLNKFARDAADKLVERNLDAERFLLLANIALNRDDVAAEKLNVICPDPQSIDELRDALDVLMKEAAE